ncbi:MAG TPA: glycosyltransferase family 4 protein [Vicinamibacterales bacterium]|nr:glycosyltransferase family 4 protein [Vicinamibacterales bacterium]
MTPWHILTPEYPPDVGGVSDYTQHIAEALSREGEEVHVWCPPSAAPRALTAVQIHAEAGQYLPSNLRTLAGSLDAFPAPRRLLVQWVPHGFGCHSMNLAFCWWLADRAAKGDRVELMVHEAFSELRLGPVRHMAMAVVQRLMTTLLMRTASRVWVSIPAWAPLLRPYALGRNVRIDWLPIPSCLISPDSSDRCDREKYAEASRPLVGHFGSFGEDVSTLLDERLPSIMNSNSQPSLLLIGARSETFRDRLIARYPDWSNRVHATGYVEPTALASYLDACDLFVQPYPDGISSRRTSAMACLSRGCPIVTTSGHLTEQLWRATGAVSLADVLDPDGFAAAAVGLLDDESERRRLAERGRVLYHERFDLAHTIAALRAA